jgi:predicted lipoprotein with Yx(FWY)xxD motif
MKAAKWVWWVLAVIVAVSLAVWLSKPKKTNEAENQTPPAGQTQAQDTVKLGSKEPRGNFLADQKGMTLYYFANDKIGKSNCGAGPCLANWPVFSQSGLAVSGPISRSDFGKITRGDGKTQTTYKGWPLYYFIKDKQPGDTLGVGVLNSWDVMPSPFYTVMVENQAAAGGNYLITPAGMTLYTFAKDTPGAGAASPQSNCSGQCLALWPAFSADSVVAPSLLKLSDFTTFLRPDGSKQLAYKGWPLYRYSADSMPGDLKGQGFNNLWFAAKQ